MFSGIVEEMGVVRSLRTDSAMPQWDGSVGEGVELTVEASTVLGDVSLGCSIAVNGVCLTVTEFDGGTFHVGLAPETLRRSNLGALAPGDPVNLERALPAAGRNSGHFVQGHVDGTGTVAEVWPEDDSLWIRVRTAPEVLRYIVPKGFIAVDGTSLTVCDVDRETSTFTFMLVAYTQQHVVLPRKGPGAAVNLEVDILGKYVERSLGTALEGLDALATRVAMLEEQQQQGAAATAAVGAGAGAGGGSGGGGGGGDAGCLGLIADMMGDLEHKIKNRDLVIDAIEQRLNRLERQKL